MMFDRHNKKSLATRSRHYITIEEVQLTSDGIGGHTEQWAKVKDVFAAVEPIKATQQYNYRSVGVDATHRITMSGLVEIDESQRIDFNGRKFEILTIEDYQEMDFTQVITVKEVR